MLVAAIVLDLFPSAINVETSSAEVTARMESPSTYGPYIECSLTFKDVLFATNKSRTDMKAIK